MGTENRQFNLTLIQPLASLTGFNFPERLYNMLEYVDTHHNEAISKIVSWQPHGRCFRVHYVKQFELYFVAK